MKTSKVHDDHIQKIKHQKWFTRLIVLFYKRRRYACVFVGSEFQKYLLLARGDWSVRPEDF